MTLEAIESVMRQQFFRVEIIVVDDGSTDATLAEVNTLFPDIITMRLHGVGPGRARNAGVAAATGDILMFLDSDDLWLGNHVQQLVNVLNRGFPVAYGVAHMRCLVWIFSYRKMVRELRGTVLMPCCAGAFWCLPPWL